MMTDRKEKKARKMGLGLISAGFIFLFFPDFTVIDILPDIIGYLMISSGLTRLADMYDEFEDAKRSFHRLILLGAAKMLSIFVVYLFSDGNEQPTTILTTVFILAVAECLILIPSFIKLFDALVHAATRLDGKAVFEGPKNKIGYVDKIKRFTVTFVILKNLFWVYPETKALAITDGFMSYNYSSYDFVNHYRFICMVVILTLGIIWITKIRKYFSSILKDELFIDKLVEKYNCEILPNPSIFARRKLNTALSVYMMGAVLAIDFYISGNAGFNLLPDVLSAICFLIASALLSGKSSKMKLPSIVLSAVYGTISAISYYQSYSFNQNHHPFDVSRKPIAFQSWNMMLAVSIIEAILFTAMITVTGLFIYETVKNNTGYTPIHETIDPIARAKELHRDIKKLVIVSSVFAVINSLAAGFRVYSFSIYSLAEGSWLIEFAASAVFACVFLYTLHKIKEKSEEKYLFS